MENNSATRILPNYTPDIGSLCMKNCISQNVVGYHQFTFTTWLPEPQTTSSLCQRNIYTVLFSLNPRKDQGESGLCSSPPSSFTSRVIASQFLMLVKTFPEFDTKLTTYLCSCLFSIFLQLFQSQVVNMEFRVC